MKTNLQRLGNLRQLLRMIRESVYWFPPNNVKAIFGEWLALLPPYHKYSEFNLLRVTNRQALVRLLRFVADATFLWYKQGKGKSWDSATVPAEIGGGAFAWLSRWIRSETPEDFKTQRGKVYDGEAWVYLNGIITDRSIATWNGEYLAALFGRQIHVIHNPTDALFFDVIETMASRIWHAFSVADQYAYEIVLKKLQDPTLTRVVWIVHSQGTVIAGNVLQKLQENHLDLLWKLELYTMANCSSLMIYKTDSHHRRVPYMEHFANDNDLICRLGVLAQAARRRKEVRIEGPVFLRKAWGHLLNAHYLRGVEQRLYLDRETHQASRLYRYLGGKTPTP